MSDFPYRTALIIGAGPGISASLARRLSKLGVQVGLAARDIEKLKPLADEIAASAFVVDASQPDQMAKLFLDMESQIGTPDVVIYNASARVPGPLASVDPAAVQQAIAVSAFGAFLAAQQAAMRMEPNGHGAIFFTGASAGTKGFAQSAAFAIGKFGMRGLAQSAARELGPKGIHVAHFIIDGGVRSSSRPVPSGQPDSLLDPDAIAQTYIDVLAQPRNAWSHEVDLRPWTERF
ncbi:SDR family NAD(P)-dependent oxidoreductase [Sphingomonas sp. TREG-RG-20F-R18-01]|uniref:SDR family NAD(P)-dependent oxidoreductase n=1 Tax=Sphingomonas sp. TREG-RG-20F-R18-01 TaxID=2914982 RepID=UPI001F59E6EC|nr:SDR family NAD(P)-dependent oxidoreductase [Sphingomonas sp. TREG-RG-20F-R18-01]